MKRTIAIWSLLAFFGVTAPGNADDGDVELKATALKRVVIAQPDGTEEVALLPTERVIPGDVITYQIEARNVSVRPAERVTITDPIPEHMRYVAGSATRSGAELLFSVDGGMRFDGPEQLEVLEADGTRRPATAEDYTHVRWVLAEPLAPSQKQSVEFLAELE